MNYLKYKDVNIGRDERINLGEYKAKGEIRLVTRWPDGQIAQDTGWTRNLMTDQGLIDVGNGGSSDWARYCHIGTSNATPLITDTKLGSWLAVDGIEARTEANGGSLDYECIGTMQYRFDAGDGQGIVRELGISNSNNPTTYLLAIHTLVTPEINWDITQTLDVFWRMTLYPSLIETSGQVTIDTELYNWISRPSQLDVGDNPFFGWGSVVSVTHYTGNIGAGPNDIPGGSLIVGTIDSQTVVAQGSGFKNTDIGYGLDDLDSPANSIQSSNFGMETNLSGPGDQGRQVQWNRVSDQAPIQKDETKIITFHVQWTWGRFP